MKILILLVAALVPAALWAQSQQCPLENATLKGVYTVRLSGLSMGSPFALVGLATFDGQGSVQVTGTGSTNGNIVRSITTGTYTVNPDCTGSHTLFGGALQWDMVVTPNGRKAYTISTSPAGAGNGATGTYVRQPVSW